VSHGVRVDSALLLRGRGGQAAHERWIELLAALATRRSIVAAAKAVGLSYKAAWDALDTLNNLAEAPLLERAVGGRGGGGTRLTAAGAQLVRVFRNAQQENAAFLRRLNRGDVRERSGVLTLGRLSLRSSARNQYAGTVTRVRRGAVNSEVELRLGGGETLVAMITRSSAVRLGLRRGVAVMAWIKASSVIVVTQQGSAVKLSARNCLAGTVARIQRGAVNSEVVIEFGGGNTIAAVVTNASARALGLRRGSRASAIFKASSVILVREA
jgi:molybdate transport system regulatory protein